MLVGRIKFYVILKIIMGCGNVSFLNLIDLSSLVVILSWLLTGLLIFTCLFDRLVFLNWVGASAELINKIDGERE